MSSTRPTRATPAGRTYLELQNLARRTRRNTQELLQRYALESFLARLAVSAYAGQLVLKGGVLLAAFALRRATRDVDLQGRRLPNDMDTVLRVVREVAVTELDDGIVFDANAAAATTIRDDDEYSGVRVSLTGRLATARIDFHVDVNVGDPIWPAPRPVAVPGLLGRSVAVSGYPLTMVYAEKIVTAIERGPTNTRWRDFADVYLLSGIHETDAEELRTSIDHVVAYRKVAIASLADVLRDFPDVAQAKWVVWRRKQDVAYQLPERIALVVDAVAAFADPVLINTIGNHTWSPGDRRWQATS